MTDKFSLLAGIAADWWWEMDAELRFTFLSERFVEIFGLPPSIAVGKLCTEVVPADYDDPVWRAHLDDLAGRRPYRDFEVTLTDASGTVRPIKISGTPLFGADGTFQGYVGVGHDLTELRRQAGNVESILANIEQGVVLLDRDFTIVAYNHRLAEWLEIPDRDLHGLPYEQFLRDLAERGEYVNEDKEAAVTDRMGRLPARERFVRERRRKDGRIMSITFNPLPAGGGVMTYTDVTEARNREAELALSEENFRHRFRNLPLAQWVYSLETLRFLEVNDAALAKYGYTQEEFLTMTLADIRPPEDIGRMMHWLAPERIGNAHTIEWQHRCKDGRILDVEAFGRNVDFNGERARIVLIIDNTARRQAERQTERIIETSQDLIHVNDSFGKFVRVSPSTTAILGYRPEELLGRAANEFIHPEDIEAVRVAMRAARQGNDGRRFRCRYYHKDGHLVSLLWSGVWSERDRHYYFIGRDMTDHDRTEEQLRRSQRMEAIGQLTGGVAHDFNNILTIILANVEALDEDEGLDPPLRKRVKGIAAATERAADLTRQLLAYSRKQALQPQRTDINELVAATAKLLERTLGAAIQVESALGRALWNAEIDGAQLESALVNLAVNARDAMPDGGRLLIETENASLDARYVAQNPDAAAGDYVMLAVTDNGTGMAPDVVARAFEPFFTTKEVGKGTGLGLSMVYGFIKQSNGHLSIYSEPGRGTTVKLFLPRAAVERPAAAVTQRAVLPGGNERILVAEDNDEVREGVVRQLQTLGYDVSDAPDGSAALGKLEAAPQPYDLLLTDVIMPGAMNGKGLADEAARRWPETKIVFMSGYTENAIIREGRLDPGILLLNKPFAKRDLAAIVRKALDAADRV
ncbi:MAG: PAS domain S-box protein [Reyranella sp.]|nr:PAS domain S-box protein [Reyranella sp.]MDP3163217.1 PAS domain S-box protein [Reyranella sp.]